MLRFAQRDGWNVAFASGAVLIVHKRAVRGVLVLPAALLEHARNAGWRVSRRPGGFELRHAAVRHRVELKLAVA